MRLSSYLPLVLTFVAAIGLSLLAASYSVQLVEDRSEIGVRDALDSEGLTWAEVTADGLQVTLLGTAPTESKRFHALTAAGSVVDAARVIDEMNVESQAGIAPPRFSVEILRNDAGISAIGLLPASEDRVALGTRLSQIAGDKDYSDFLETADHPVPDGWSDAMAFAISALERLPRAKISVEAGRVAVTAMTQSRQEKIDLERALRRITPPSLNVALDLTAPRPVLTPFTLRFVHDADGVRFDACSADSEDARDRIVEAAKSAGMTGPGRCTVGMGVPSPNWADAAEMAIDAVAELGGGSVTFSDADVALRAPIGTRQAVFDRVVGELENALPEVFALKAVLPEAEDPSAGPPEFVATLSPEGLVQLRGRINDAATQQLSKSYAQSLFGTDKVHTAARVDDDLPGDWPTRVLTGLDALAKLSNGTLIVRPDRISVSGDTGNADANAQIAQILADKLGEAQDFDIKVSYQEELDPVAGLPTPEECEAEIGAITDARKINFEPGSATIDSDALGIVDDIAEILKQCGDLKLEIQGHTDSQGRESMNLELSQERAQSVLNELRARRVLTASFTAKGYGEEQPIADNGTEAGREANRRIEFRLIQPEPLPPEPESTLDSVAQQDKDASSDDSGESQDE